MCLFLLDVIEGRQLAQALVGQPIDCEQKWIDFLIFFLLTWSSLIV